MTVMRKEEYYNMYDAAQYLWWYKSLRELIGHYFRRHIPKNAKILDAGCGTGENIAYLESVGYSRIKGIDLSEDSILLCKKRGLKNVVQGDLKKLPFEDNSFDAVYSMDVLGLIPEKERKQVIHELYRVLKPGGWLIIQCAALEWLRSEHDVVVSMHHRFTKKEIKEEFRQFELQKLSYRFFILFPLMSLVKLLKRPSAHKKAHSDVDKPHPVLNTVLLAIQRVENALFTWISLPIGTSLFLVARKTEK